MAKSAGKVLERALRARMPAPYAWLDANYDELKPIIDKQAHPSWTALADAAREVGVTGPIDGGPSRQTMRSAWLRLEADRAGGAAQPTSKPPIAARRSPPPATRPGDPPALQARDAEEDDEAATIDEPMSKFSGRRPVDRFKPKGTD